MEIPVTKPFFPNRMDLEEYLEGIWKREWLTNNGPLLNEYELELKRVLQVPHLLVVTNGTLALQLAFKALGISGKILTTPFSYVATTSSLVWEGCTPVFVDIDPHTFNIDPTKIESAIDENTQAIVATHCFGNACDIAAIDKIAKRHDLKVIYDASHCFGSSYKGKSLLNFGDFSTLSLHATKLIHCTEGGALVSQDPELIKRITYMRNLGHDGPGQFNGVGINGKCSELHAAMGLSVLKHHKEILQDRKKKYRRYLDGLSGESVSFQRLNPDAESNYSYFPILLESENILLEVMAQLEGHRIGTRRYFYPGLNELEYVRKQQMSVCDSIAQRILCLPLYFDLSEEEQLLIIRIVKRVLRYLK